MPDLSLVIKPVNQLKQKLIGRIILCGFVDLPECEFKKYVAELEKDGLFKKLVDCKVLRFKRFLRTGWSAEPLELAEKTVSGKSSVDIMTLIETKGKTVQLIKSMGSEKFKEYFLYNDRNLTFSQVAQSCNLSEADVKSIYTLLDELEINAGFHQIPDEGKMHYTRIGAIEKNNAGGFVINYFSTQQAKGRYDIDYQKLEFLQKKESLSPEEFKKVAGLVKKLELVNICKTILWQIVDKIISVQNSYLCSGKYEDIVPCTQKTIAVEIGITPSIICRLIQYKTIILPWGEEKKLKELLPHRKELIKSKLKDIIDTQKELFSDSQLKYKLERDFNIVVSRRSISQYRQELKLFSSLRRN